MSEQVTCDAAQLRALIQQNEQYKQQAVNNALRQGQVQTAQSVARTVGGYEEARRTSQKDAITNSAPYYTQVRFAADPNTVGLDTTYTLQPYGENPRKGNSYGTGGGDMASAGFPTGQRATIKNTNLTKPGETLPGNRYKITHIKAVWSYLSDPLIIAHVMSCATVELQMNSSTGTTLLGRLENFASALGRWEARTVPPPLDSSLATYDFPQNNRAGVSSIYKLPEPIWWSPEDVDKVIEMPIRVADPFVHTVSERLAGPGVAPYTPPQTLGEQGTYADLTIILLGNGFSPASKNASVNG